MGKLLKLATDSNGIRKILLNSKPVNVLNPPLLHELRSELSDIHRNKDIRGLIFGSEFSKVLSAGLDLKTLVAHEDFYLPDENRKATIPDYEEKYRNHIKQYLSLFQVCQTDSGDLQITTDSASPHCCSGGMLLFNIVWGRTCRRNRVGIML
jgi:hypothetical protein